LSSSSEMEYGTPRMTTESGLSSGLINVKYLT
jgi:hypothetical protein